ncbi:endonuclease domain-containing 1 protein-like [Coregonus clupeaformis]|uniref:endonuclease domain-containing 1 protein-like n=1 Tax=Coregonus clupeaformis TaxID=59861 RepID=UPI001BE06CCB|nr:endonuclease domain-containing 1 protein-like [Coregonus clupeaformis]
MVSCIIEQAQALAWVLVLVMVEAEVQENYSPACREFMYMGTPPLGLEDKALKKICQSYNGKPRFVTLYDTFDHIPVYSAYTFKRSDGAKKVDVPWMYEPQLSTVSDFGEMQPFPQGDLHRSFEDAQAVLEDYSNAVNFERGHLNPDEHQSDPNDKAATYTLTNVVPQVREFNIGPWKTHEHTIRRRLNNYCRGTAYMVTGVTTSGNMIRRHNIDRVAVPTYLWSAYCCIDYDRNAPFEERTKFPAYAAHGLNQKERPEVLEMSVQQLENFLKSVTFVDKTFQIFYDNCVPPDNGLHMP